MKKTRIVIISILSVIVLVTYFCCAILFSKKDVTIVNNPTPIELKEQPRLEDDFFDYVNYDYLKNNNLSDEKSQWYYMYDDASISIENEKKRIIDSILSKCDEYEENTINDKICNFYYSYTNKNKDELKNGLKVYIDRINNINNINDYFDTVVNINNELSTDILINAGVNVNYLGESQPYFTLNTISYDIEVNLLAKYGIDLTQFMSDIYTLDGMDQYIAYLRKYDKKNLINYGYEEEKSEKMISNVQDFYRKLSQRSLKYAQYSNFKGYSIYTLDELKKQLTNINVDKIISNYPDLYKHEDKIMVIDIGQIKEIDKFLVEENLPVLKEYAISKILNLYMRYINEDSYTDYIRIIDYSMYYLIGKFQKSSENYNPSDIMYNTIYESFMDYISSIFEKDNLSEKEKTFFIELAQKEIEVFKQKINEKDWLTTTTKEKALNKLEAINARVSLQDREMFKEELYMIDKNYLNNIISINKISLQESSKEFLKGNYMVGMDPLTQNAFYLSNDNSINILLGEIYTTKKAFGISENNLEEKYYTILGTIGTVIGHELTHSLDINGSKYDAYGNYVDWWSKEDKENYNKLNAKVVKYYTKNYHVLGNDTLGENTADLGGMNLVLTIAEEKNATTDNYKELFESYARSWCSQATSLRQYILLMADEHSPAKVRVNAVLSSIDKFYTVYNLTPNDKMFYNKNDRVYVW